MTTPPPISNLVLDIEGTTCPVQFVSEVLFPYTQANLLAFLTSHQSEQPIRRLLQEVQDALLEDPSPIAVALRSQGSHGLDTLCNYLDWLIRTDRKSTPLKDLQGRIWDEGYQRGDLIAPLFGDVPRALERWQNQGMKLSVYSSGSVQAQKLLYSHTQSGDLSPVFSHWFDTRTGAKNDPESYQSIAATLQTQPEKILFISDGIAELVAAEQAGMAVIFSLRPGNPQRDSQHFRVIENFDALDFPTKKPPQGWQGRC
jgi:enolase-phosphatase E1